MQVGVLFQFKLSANLRMTLDNQYNRSFYDMTGYVNNVETLLVKSLIASSPTKTASMLQEAWSRRIWRKQILGNCLFLKQIVETTSRFLTQVGDLAFALNNQNMEGKNLTDDNTRQLNSCMVTQQH